VQLGFRHDTSYYHYPGHTAWIKAALVTNTNMQGLTPSPALACKPPGLMGVSMLAPFLSVCHLGDQDHPHNHRQFRYPLSPGVGHPC